MHRDQGSRDIDQGYRNTVERSQFLQWPNSLSEGISGGTPGRAYCPGGGTRHNLSKYYNRRIRIPTDLAPSSPSLDGSLTNLSFSFLISVSVNDVSCHHK